MISKRFSRGGRFCGRQGIAPVLLSAFMVFANSSFATLNTVQPVPFSRPLLFEPNVGQTDAQVRWVARGPGYQMFFTEDSLVMALRNRGGAGEAPPSVVQMKLKGSHRWKAAEGLERSESVSNYLIGKDRKGWHIGVPNYTRLKESEVYDGIDMVFYSRGGELEYDFEVAPGADPKQIRMTFDGAEHIRVDEATGDLLMTVSSGAELRQLRPQIYQQIGSRRVEVAGRYEVLDRGQVTFALAGYDRSRALVIDPTIAFTVFFAGESYDYAYGVAIDPSHNAYITGYTASIHFPLVTGTPSRGLGGYHGNADAYVAKLSPGGAIIFSTYLGGSSGDAAYAIAVDATGVYVTGKTSSPDFPVLGLASGTPPGGIDGFVTKIIPMGNDIIYSIVIGGSGEDQPQAIAVDKSGAAYITGYTFSRDFPVAGPRESHFQANYGSSAFITKLAPSGFQLVYSGYFGGNGSESGTGIAVDQNGVAYVTGSTQSSDLPVTPNMQGYTPSFYSGYPANGGYVASLDPTGATFPFLRYIGGGQGDYASAITLEPGGSLYVSGYTFSHNFPTTPLALIPQKPNPAGKGTGFLMRITSTGFTSWSTFFGSTEAANTYLTSVATGPTGDVYIGGYTYSSNIPGATTPLTPGPTAGFVTKVAQSGGAIEYTTRLGAQVNGVVAYSSPAFPIYLPPSTKVYTTGFRFPDGNTKNPDVFVVELNEGSTVVSFPF
jgi:hypothetical protein